MTYEATLEAKRRQVQDCFERIGGIRAEIPTPSEPHFVPEDSELVTKLLGVYREVTGEKDARSQPVQNECANL